MGQLVRDDVRGALEAALAAAQAEGALPRLPGIEVAVERPAQAEHGDYASSVALRLARTVKQKPLAVAEAIASRVETGPLIETVEVAPPGFINVRLAEAWKRDQVNAILTAGERWGEIDLGGGRPLQVEFVSANPTGPLQGGNGRGAVLGDVLASVLAAAGYAVEREYYVNDAGSQVRTFAQTLYARYLQQCDREGGAAGGGLRGSLHGGASGAGEGGGGGALPGRDGGAAGGAARARAGVDAGADPRGSGDAGSAVRSLVPRARAV